MDCAAMAFCSSSLCAPAIQFNRKCVLQQQQFCVRQKPTAIFITKACAPSSSSEIKSLICPDCSGNGAKVCKSCKGDGYNLEDHFNGRYKTGEICWLCRGKKQILCGNCNGAGFVGNLFKQVQKLSSHRRQLLVTGFSLLFLLTRVNCASCEQVRLEDVDNPRLKEGIRAALNGEYAYAEEIFTELISEDAKNASVWSNRGNVRISLKKYEEALDDFTQAVKLAPRAPVPLLNRAIANEALGRYKDAIDDCQAAIKIDPKEYAAWYNLGNAEVRVKDYASALTAYAKAASLAPGIAGYRLKQALVLFELHQLEPAKKLIQGLVRKYPNYAEAHAALAAILWNEGRRSQAEDELNQASSQDSKYNDIRYVKTSLDWPPTVVEAMEKFLAINTDQD